MRSPRRAIAAVLLGLSAGIGTVDSLAIWGSGTERRFLLLQSLLAVSASLVALRGQRSDLRSLTTQLRSAWKSVVPLGLLAMWLAWAGVGVLAADFGRVHGALTLAAMGTTAAAAGAVMLSLGWYGGAVVATSAVTGHALLSAIAMRTSDYDMSRGRLRLAALEPNQLARPAALTALLASVVAIEVASRRGARTDRATSRISSVTWAALALVCLGTLALTESRTATAALGAAVGIWIIVNRRYRMAAFLGLGLVAALVLVSSLGLTSRVVDRLNRGESSTAEVLTLTGRTTMWPIVLDRAKQDAGLGVGVGNDRAVVVQAAEDGDLGWSPQHAHNLALHLLLVSGLPGVGLFAASMLFAALSALWRRDAVSVAVVALLVIDGLSEAVFTGANLGWTLLACCVASPLLPLVRAGRAQTEDAVSLSSTGTATTGAASTGDHLRRTFDAARPTGALVASVALAAVVSVITFAPFGLPFRLRCAELPPESEAMVDLDGVHLVGKRVALADDTAQLMRCAGLVDGGFTLEMTVTPAKPDQFGPARIFTISDGADWNDTDFHLGQQGTALSVQVRTFTYSRSENLVDNVLVGDKQSHHVAVAVTNDRVDVFVDGEFRQSFDLRMSFESWNKQTPAQLGNEFTGGLSFFGDIGHLRVWRGVLDAERIGTLAAQGP